MTPIERFSLRKNWKLINFCEFDKYAIKSYCAIHGVDEGLNLGDITKVDETKLEDFNMICGGSPCQDFSVAGKQKGSVWTCKDCGHEYNPLTVHWSQRDKCPNCGSNNIEKTRSSLLVEYLRVIRANKPNFGMYENVKNIVGKQFRDTTFKLFEDELHEYGYNTYWKVLNAKDFGVPQNRERVYLIFIKKDLDNGKFVFPEGFDNGIRLKDVLEDEVDEKYYISDDKVQKFLENLKSENIREDSTLKLDGNNYNQRCVVHTPDDFCRTIIGSGGSGGYHAGNEPKVLVNSQSENEVKQVRNISDCNGNWKNPQVGGIYDPDGCSPTLNTCGGGSHEPKIVCGIDKSVNDTKQIEYANCITAREDRGISNRKSEGTAILETPDYSYCLDANYYKGTTIEQYVDKHRRQLVSENHEAELCDYIGTIISCLDTMNILKGELEYEERYKKCREILYVLWNEIRKETVQWEIRGLWSIQEKEILQSGMYGEIQIDTTKSRCRLENGSQYSTKNQQENLKEDKMRDLWENWKTRCSSYQLELEGQFFDEFTSFMSQLSQQDTQTQKCMLDMWTTNERVGILQQALFKIQEIWMSFNEEKRIKMSELQSNIRKPDEMCRIRIRKLTPKECFRLQGFPDSAYEAASKVVSNSQLYKQSGNSIVVDVLYYILVELYKAMPYLFNELKLSSFFSGIGAFEAALDRLYESINTGNFTKPQVE